MVLKKFANKSFVTRLISGVILVLIMLLGIIVGGRHDLYSGLPLFILNIFLSQMAIGELYRVMGIHKNILGLTGYFANLVYYLAIYVNSMHINVYSYFWLIIILFFIILMTEYVFTFPKYKTEDIANALLGMVYGGILLSFIYILREGNAGVYTVWLVFLASWGSDTCAYLAGVAFGKHKMAPVLSPKKSIEGAVGGVIGAAILGGVYAYIFRNEFHYGINPVIIFSVACAVGALISMVGDLAASAIKRNHDIKDYGKLIPGHGGVMDRFDSVIFVAPVVWMLIQFFEKIS